MRIVRSVLTGLLLVLGVAIQAQAQNAVYTLDIPAQAAERVIDALSQQIGLQPVYAENALRGVQSPGVRGTFSPRDAVSRALQGTGLTFEFTGEKAVAIRPAATVPAARVARPPAPAAQTASSPAQAPGAVSVSVTDTSGGAVPDADLLLIARGRTVQRIQPNPAGVGTFDQVPPGRYDIRGQRAGFAPTLLRSVEVKSGETATVTLTLQLAGVSETVDVAAPERYAASTATTATKTDTPLILTPVAITVIPNQVLSDQQAVRLDEALTNVAGAWGYSHGQGTGGQTDAIALRGFLEFNSARTDGLYLNAGGPTYMTGNVERVEVIKGPASILYGRLEPGGMVNVVTKKPRTTPAHSLEQTFGTRNIHLTTVDSTGPLGKQGRLQYRLIASWNAYDNKWAALRYDNKLVQGSLNWDVGQNTSLLIEGRYSLDNSPWWRGDYPTDQVTGEYIVLPPSKNLMPNTSETRTPFGKATLSHAFNRDWSLKTQVMRNHYSQKSDGFQIGGFVYEPSGATTVARVWSPGDGKGTDTAVQFDVTGHFQTGRLRHTTLFGSDWYRNSGESSAPNPIDVEAGDYVKDLTDAFNPSAPSSAGVSLNATFSSESVQTNSGFYVQDQLALPGNLHLLAGARYSRAVFDSQFSQGGVFVTVFGADPLSVSPRRSDDAFTPRVGLLWGREHGTSAYASYSENFGKYQGNYDYQDQALDPERSNQKEVGFKHESTDQSWSTQFSIYEIKKVNQAIIDPNHAGCRLGYNGLFDAADSFCYIAAGSTRSRGVEAEMTGELRPGWSLLANYTYNKTRVLDDGGAGNVGKSIGYFPDHMFKLATTYRIGGRVKVGGTVNHIGQTDLGISSPYQTVAPAYTLVDLLGSYEMPFAGRKLSLQLNLRNVANTRYQLTPSVFPWWSTVPLGDPRTLYARLRIEL